MAGVLVRMAENLLVRIETADGNFGWGEAASAPTMTGETLWGMASAARLISDAIQHQDLRFRAAVLDRARRAVHGNLAAQSAIEMALLDLIGRALGIEAIELIGGRRRDTLAPMWLLGQATPEDDAAEAAAKHAEGYGFFKLKVGAKNLEDDIAAALAVRKAVGSSATLCADANAGLTAAAAAAFMRGAQDAALAFLEQPLPAQRLGEMAALQALGLLPIGADEGIHSVEDIETHAASKAVAGVSLKLIKLGGPEAMLRAALRASTLGLNVNVAAKVAETSLASAAAAHLACAVPNVDWGISLTQVYLEHDPVLLPMVVKQGRLTPPSGPGLGVDVDQAAVTHYRALSP
jgi:muconate cycloisomerase